MADPKPTDYKAEAQEWLEHIGNVCMPPTQCPECLESLAALLERLCGEAREAEEAETLIWRKLVDDLRQQLAAAQKEIERLRAEAADASAYAHGVGQEHTIVDVNAGRIDDLIAPRIEQAREEGFRECDGQWQMSVGFAITGMEREKVIAQVREEGRREQREKDAKIVCQWCADDSPLAAPQSIGEPIRDAVLRDWLHKLTWAEGSFSMVKCGASAIRETKP